MAHFWFIVRDGKEVGPISTERFKELAKDGSVLPETLIRRQDMPTPVAARKVTGLFQRNVDSLQPIETPPPQLLTSAPHSSFANTATAIGRFRLKIAAVSILGCLLLLYFVVPTGWGKYSGTIELFVTLKSGDVHPAAGLGFVLIAFDSQAKTDVDGIIEAGQAVLQQQQPYQKVFESGMSRWSKKAASRFENSPEHAEIEKSPERISLIKSRDDLKKRLDSLASKGIRFQTGADGKTIVTTRPGKYILISDTYRHGDENLVWCKGLSLQRGAMKISLHQDAAVIDKSHESLDRDLYAGGLPEYICFRMRDECQDLTSEK